MRDALSSFLSGTAKADPNFVVLSGDHGYALFDDLRKTTPKQFINAGVSEQAMVAYSAGLSKQGFRPVVYGLSAFVPMRVLEFIKMDVCYENLPVIFLGDGAGLVYSTLGPSHQCGEDIACLRPLPHLQIFSPADAAEMKACLETALALTSPVYIRIGKSDRPAVHAGPIAIPQDHFFPVAGAKSKTAFIATGSMVSAALSLSKKIPASVFSAPRLTALHAAKILTQIQGYSTIVTMEEHSIDGGLGSILAECLAESSTPTPRLIRIGLRHRFTEKCGSYDYAMKEHGLDEETIFQALKKILP